MAKYRKKPVVVEAIQWNGDANYDEVCRFVGETLFREYGDSDTSVMITTFEGDLTASIGDYIIKGLAGEFYSVSPEIFRASYEEVSS
ncbi:hypothetical protein [Paenibacillus polymyxa]|uniref:Phage protein n=1 Tax=Paenibacillus polymyxa TaxID=1406 RepID=A0ABX2ZI09_PAEPO|nr:hypothetical protein [Paenibacillus polymyxa]ODA08447.1 hypothetical protein A7312_03280 [Paenibacillus polymyxa]